MKTYENTIGLSLYSVKNLEIIDGTFIIPAGVTEIGDNAFSSCWNLKELIIPEGVTKIGDYAFFGCCEVKKIVIPAGVKFIGTCAFSGCSQLSSLNLPEGVSLGGQVLAGCELLKGMTFPASITEREKRNIFGASQPSRPIRTF